MMPFCISIFTVGAEARDSQDTKTRTGNPSPSVWLSDPDGS